MPMYLEGRNVANLEGVSGGHMYFVYLPIGEGHNYSAGEITHPIQYLGPKQKRPSQSCKGR